MTTRRDNTAMPSPNADLIDAYLRHLAAAGHPSSTTDTYRAPLRRVDRELPSGLLAEPDELLDWLGGLRTAATRALYRTAIRSFYAWAVDARHLSCNPATELPTVRRPRRQPRPITHQQLATILARAREPFRTWSRWMAYAGLRCVEVARLRLPDDVTDQLIYVHSKGCREDTVPTHPDLWAEAPQIPAMLASCGLKPEWLGGGLDRDQISHRCNAEYERLGLAGVTAHRLRHWYGTYVHRAAGGDIRVTQRLMRHQHVTTTEIYTAVAADHLRDAVERLPRIGAGA